MVHTLDYNTGVDTEKEGGNDMFNKFFCPEGGSSAVSTASGKMPSMVRVYFPKRGTSHSYYNDSFELSCGDTVFVDGSLKGLQGRVVEVSRGFKIKLSDYRRVIAKADTLIRGELYSSVPYLYAFDNAVIPFEKVATWVMPPADEDEIYVRSYGGEKIPLDDLGSMNVTEEIARRGGDYYRNNAVLYIELNGKNGRAVVEGTRAYTVEFELDGGVVTNLSCDCVCGFTCKHSVAALLQLRDAVKAVNEEFGAEYANSGYFAMILRGTLYEIAFSDRRNRRLTIG